MRAHSLLSDIFRNKIYKAIPVPQYTSSRCSAIMPLIYGGTDQIQGKANDELNSVTQGRCHTNVTGMSDFEPGFLQTEF